MSDDVIDFAQRKERREIEAAERAGLGWHTYPFDYDDDTSVGVCEDTERPVVVLCGDIALAMSVEDAKRLGEALIQAAASPFPPGEGE
jgi:hypothetical protein